MEFISRYFSECQQVIDRIDQTAIASVIKLLLPLKKNTGRLFILGVGGSAANASHAVNDFRKIVDIEAYAPTDNVAELTARTNDDGWQSVFSEWLKVSRLNSNDVVFVLSVGGGNLEKNISPNLVLALQYAKSVGAKIIGIVSRDGGYTASVADACIVIPVVSETNTTPHAEAFQAVIWHLLVSHPDLKSTQTKWESVIHDHKNS
ncbi:MAG: sugar isomerase [Gammaproteobacteria bacterium RIFCSPHIGHO2_12_FULL_40_19]|nr:MAG: sugar isomerase [Gammaproteobacteria bacterium RIFCSPHIGHO2_12_FULL_40_19]